MNFDTIVFARIERSPPATVVDHDSWSSRSILFEFRISKKNSSGMPVEFCWKRFKLKLSIVATSNQWSVWLLLLQ